MQVNIPATKTNLLKIKKTLLLTQEGYELLDEKRRILMNELNSVIYVVDRIQKDVDNALHEAYGLLDKAVVTMGRKRLEELSFSVDIKSDLSISHKRVMGVNVPVINLNMIENPPYYSPYEVNFYVDETIESFKEVLKLLKDLAEKKITLLRIAREVQKTIRKVNALEKIHIPYYKESFKIISERLDEAGRESFSMSKLIKERLRNQG